MPRNKKSNKINPIIFVLICGCLLFAMYISLSPIALGLWGQTVMGTVILFKMTAVSGVTIYCSNKRTVIKLFFYVL